LIQVVSGQDHTIIIKSTFFKGEEKFFKEMSFNDKVVLLSDVLPDCRFRLSCLAAEGKAYMMQDYI